MEKRVKINGIEDIELEQFELCENLIEEECIIKTSFSMISPGTELSRVFGLKKGATYPVYPGYCSVGTVKQKAEGFDMVSVGDRVLFSAPHGSCQVFNYLKSDGKILYKLNPKLSDEEGCFLMMCWIALNGILPVDVKVGSTVGIFGMGNLGIILALIYQNSGCKVYGIDPVKSRCEHATKMGLKHVIDCEPSKQKEEIQSLTNKEGFEIVVDASGMSKCIEVCIDSASVFGQVVLLGSPRESYQTDMTPIFNQIHTKMLKVIGAMNRRYPYFKQE